ncbi:YihY/virulence factor BrkB family protein [Romboutsia sedimentorum]|uniref:YihY/virulence factor BrkB family protein n=1 Tax=Romboutsia sedimentorum TaxID=1368474 RepID=A0ABT7EA41_9FIRM|nr:YihY/virulence factor BrkB family protein [Romboutsia sedimentorum]MDK2563792.1 YihY/virulence factor BrkB family protein [Romboutsia sedimentorum]MDK2585468.1 YihY/virulence factor BrkB family protein [Romboutsia sedimentorum]
MIKIDSSNVINTIKKESNYAEINSKAAEMSFYLLLSFFPFLIFTISSIAYTPILHLNKYISIFQNMMPESAFQITLSIINSAMENKSLSFIITSFVLTLWTSSRAVRGIIRGANNSYKVKETRSYIKVMFIGLFFTVILLVLIFSSMIFLVYGEKIGYLIFGFIGLDNIFMNVWNICRYTIGVSTIVIILVSLYKYTPNKKIKIKDAIPGAVIATFGWIIVSLSYSYYSNYYANYEVIYGSIGGIIVLMTWIYLSSWMMLVGAEINAKLYFRKLNKTSYKN